ncbi:MAG: 1-acyl-sn-glycerol-3-phosphate acyltransferase [Planctomycetota bacterium]
MLSALGRFSDWFRWELQTLKFVARPVLWLYHSRKTVVGEPTFGGGRIVAFSHPFHLLDPAHVHLALGRGRLYYLADSVILFGTPRTAWMSRRCRALPLHRRESGKTDRGSQRENARFLQEAIQHLATGSSVAIAPEGRSTAQRSLWRFKAGLCRLAFETAKEHDWPDDLRVVLVGLTYRRMRRPYDGSLTVAIDEAVSVNDWRDRHERDARQTDREFLDHLEERMRALTADFGDLPPGFVEDLAELLDADDRARGNKLERDDRVTLRRAVAILRTVDRKDPASWTDFKRDLSQWLSDADHLLVRPGSDGLAPRIPPIVTLALEVPTLLGFLLWWPAFLRARAVSAQIAKQRKPKHRSRAGTQELFAIVRVFALWFVVWNALAASLWLGGLLPAWGFLTTVLGLLALGALARKRHRHARLAWLRLCRSTALADFSRRGDALRRKVRTLESEEPSEPRLSPAPSDP